MSRGIAIGITIFSDVIVSAAVIVSNFLLQENGNRLLLESGDRISLES